MEVLDAEQMASLIASVTEKIERELLIANRFGTLEETLKKYNLEEEQTEEIVSSYYMPNAKILILGAVTSKKNDIEKTFKNIGIPPSRVEIIEDYEKLPGFNVEKLRNSTRYSDILVCAMPHKMKNIGDYPDLISLIEHNQSEYPLLNRITNEAGELKFSINGLRNAIMKTKIYKEIL